MSSFLRLELTGEQAHALGPILAQANAPLSPDVVLCQVRRLEWTEGDANLVMECKVIPRATAAKLRKVLESLPLTPSHAQNRLVTEEYRDTEEYRRDRRDGGRGNY